MGFAVVDSSFVLNWLFREEGHEAGRPYLKRLTEEFGVSPALWATEVCEGLRSGVARGRVSREDADGMAVRVGALLVTQDEATWAQAWVHARQLAHREGLSVYDAAYLELAVRKSLPILTFDRKLREAAKAWQVLALPRL